MYLPGKSDFLEEPVTDNLIDKLIRKTDFGVKKIFPGKTSPFSNGWASKQEMKPAAVRTSTTFPLKLFLDKTEHPVLI